MEPNERKSISFFRSYYEAACLIADQSDRADFYHAIFTYVFTGKEPMYITGTPMAMFKLVKPNLDNSLKKAEAGAVGGSKSKVNRKQSSSKSKANNKQSKSKPQGIKDKGYIELDKGDIPPYNPPLGEEPTDPFEKFWKVYPKKKSKGAARKAFENALKKEGVTGDVLIDAVNRQRCGAQWTKDNGQFIPYPATWLNQERWEDEPDVDNVSRKHVGNPKNDTQLGFQRLLGFMGVDEEEQTDEQN